MRRATSSSTSSAGGIAAWKAYVGSDHACRRRGRTLSLRSVRRDESVALPRLPLIRSAGSCWSAIRETSSQRNRAGRLQPVEFRSRRRAVPGQALPGPALHVSRYPASPAGPQLTIPVNCPFHARVNNHQRDGLMRVDGDGRAAVELRAERPGERRSRQAEVPIPTASGAPPRSGTAIPADPTRPARWPHPRVRAGGLEGDRVLGTHKVGNPSWRTTCAPARPAPPTRT